MEGVSRTAQVSVAVVGSSSGDDEMEYCRMRMGGSMVRKSPKGRVAEGNSSRRSSTERRLFAISFSKSLPARASICVRALSSGMVAAIRVMFCAC